MATVRVTAKLLADVKQHIKEVAKSVHTATIAPRDPMTRPEFKDELITVAMLHAWKGYEHLRTVVPVSWLKKVERLDVRVGTPEYQIPGSFIVPPTTKGFSGSYAEINLSEGDTPFEIAQPLQDHRNLEKEHEHKFSLVCEKVTDFLGACKSVNDALKKYPDIALYLPQEIKDSVDRVVERSNARIKDAPVDTGLTEEDRSLLTATGVVSALFAQK